MSRPKKAVVITPEKVISTEVKKKITAYMKRPIGKIDGYIKQLDKNLPQNLKQTNFAKQFLKKLMLDIASQLYGQVMEFKIKINDKSEIEHADETMNIAIGYNKRCDEVNSIMKDFIWPRVNLELNAEANKQNKPKKE